MTLTGPHAQQREREREPLCGLFQGLASGYLRLPQETKTRFIKTPEARHGWHSWLGLSWREFERCQIEVAELQNAQAIREVLPQCGPITYLTGDVGRYQNQDGTACSL